MTEAFLDRVASVQPAGLQTCNPTRMQYPATLLGKTMIFTIRMQTWDPLNDERLDRSEIDFIKRVITTVGKDVEDPETLEFYRRSYIRMRGVMRFAAAVTPVGTPN